MSRRFEKMITEAYQMIPLYARYKEKQNLEVEKLFKESKWSQFPLLERNEIVGQASVMLMPWAMPLLWKEKMMYARTSGSTGKYMEIYWTPEDYRRSMLSLWYYRYKYYQITPKDKVCYFYTINNLEQETDMVNLSVKIICMQMKVMIIGMMQIKI